MKRKMSVVILLTVCAVTFSAFLTSCSTPTAGTKVVSYPSAEVKENSLLMSNRIRVTDLRKTKVNDLTKIQITAENFTRHHFQFEYRFRWLDKDGFEVPSPLSTWVTVDSLAKDTFNMSGMSPTVTATDFELVVKIPDRW